MIKNKLAVRFALFFAIFSFNQTAYSAPQIPDELLDNSLVYCTNVSGFSFDPQKADMGTNMNVVTEQIYDKLVEFDPVKDKLKPSLAKRFTRSRDGLTLRFYLRKGVKFQTTDWFAPTRDFNAEDVVFSLSRVLGEIKDLSEFNSSNKLKDQEGYRNYLFQKKSNKTHFPYFESIDLNSKIKSVKAISKYVVEIKLNQRDSSLLAHLASQYAVILSKEYATQLSADDNLAQLDLLPVGTGVYQVENYAQNEYVRLKANPDYWGEKANIENLVIDFSSNGTGRMAKFLNKECDISAFPEPSQLSSIPRGRFANTAGANLAFLAFNFLRPEMRDINLRRKIARAINRERLQRTLFYGVAEVAYNVLPAALFADKDMAHYPYRPDLSYDDKDLIPLTMWVVNEKHVYNLHPLKMAELIRHDLRQVGIKLTIKPVSRSYLVQQLEARKADYDLILTGWLANNYDPDNFLSAVLGCESQKWATNVSNWCSLEFEGLLSKARIEPYDDERTKLYKQAELLFRERLPILPLLNVNRLLVINERVEDVSISPFGQVNLSKVKLKKSEDEKSKKGNKE